MSKILKCCVGKVTYIFEVKDFGYINPFVRIKYAIPESGSLAWYCSWANPTSMIMDDSDVRFPVKDCHTPTPQELEAYERLHLI